MSANKRRAITLLFFLLIAISLSWLSSCADEDCLSIYNNYLTVGFLKADTLANGKIELSELDTVFYSVTAEENDSVFYDKDDVVSTLTLPVNPATGFTSFRLDMIDSIGFDSLTMEKIYYVNPIPQIISVSYRRSERIISEECGVEISFTEVALVDSTFQHTVLFSNKLSRLNELINKTNIEILF